MARATAIKTKARRTRASVRRRARGNWERRYATPLRCMAIVRIALGVLAIPLAPALYRKHFLLLVLMRPTKEVLLFGGFLARQHKTNLLEIAIAAIPLAIFGVWLSFALGRAHTEDIRKGKVPGIGKRLLPVDKIKRMQKLLRRRGAKLVLVGRLAAFPSALVGAAAGSAAMDAKEFIVADGIGAMLSIAEAVGAGYVLGGAYQHGKKWLVFVGIAALAALAVLVGRYLRQED